MASRITRIQLESPYIKALFYGQPGSTKTRTVATAAMDERLSPVLMLDSSGNPISIRNYPQLPDIVQIDSLTEYNPIYEWLAAGQPEEHGVPKSLDLHPPVPYKTVIIDGVTGVQRMSFSIVIGTTKAGPGTIQESAEFQHFNKVLAQMVTFAKLFYSLHMNVLITSLEREDVDEATKTIHYKPLLWGQSAGEVPGYAYLVSRLVHRARLENKDKMDLEEAHRLHIIEDSIGVGTVSVALFRPTGKYIAKDQYGKCGPFMVNPTMTKILDKILAVEPVLEAGANPTNPTPERNLT
jgi:hypothetical protein